MRGRWQLTQLLGHKQTLKSASPLLRSRLHDQLATTGSGLRAAAAHGPLLTLLRVVPSLNDPTAATPAENCRL